MNDNLYTKNNAIVWINMLFGSINIITNNCAVYWCVFWSLTVMQTVFNATFHIEIKFFHPKAHIFMLFLSNDDKTTVQFEILNAYNEIVLVCSLCIWKWLFILELWLGKIRVKLQYFLGTRVFHPLSISMRDLSLDRRRLNRRTDGQILFWPKI